MALQPSSVGTIAMETVGAQSANDLSFSVKTQIRSVLEILVLAMPHPPVFQGRIKQSQQWLARHSGVPRPVNFPSATMAGAQPVFLFSVRPAPGHLIAQQPCSHIL